MKTINKLFGFAGSRLPSVSRLCSVLAVLQICGGALAFCPQPLSPPDLKIRKSAAAEDGAGGAFSAWIEERFGFEGSLPSVHLQRLNGQGAPLWGPAGTSQHAVAPSNVLVAPSGDGGALLAWTDISETIRVQRYSAAGTPLWTAGGIIVPADRGFNGPLIDLVQDGAGGAFVLHVDELNDDPPEDALLLSHIGAGGAVEWVRVISPGCAGTIVTGADAVSDRTGGVVIAQEARCGEFPTVRAHRVNALGERLWGPTGFDVSSAPAQRSQVAVSASSDGAWFHIGWLDSRGQPEPFNNKATLFVQLLNSAGLPQWTANGIPASSNLGSAELFGSLVPRIALLSRGPEAFVLWSNQPSPPPYWSNQVTAQRIDANGQRLWGVGNGVVLGASYAGRGEYLTLAGGGGTGVIAGWTSFEYGEQSTSHHNVYSQRLDDSGNRLWGEAPYPVAAFARLDETPGGLVATAPGQALYLWHADAMWVRNLPDWKPCLRRAQTLRIVAAGTGWQLLTYDYMTGQQGVTPYSPFNRAVTYFVKPDEWSGLFLYDYQQGRFTTAVYAGLDETD